MKVFIIEDSLFTSRLLTIQLKKKNQEVEIFQKVTYALAQIGTPPDIIILDHYLLEFNGVDSLPAIKERYPKAKIIMYSGQDDVKIVADAFENGVDLYFSKDVHSPKKISSVVEDIMNQIDEESSTVDDIFVKLKNVFSTKGKPRSRKKIFIVEDDNLFSFMLTKKLHDECNVDVENFTSASQCIEHLDVRPDVVILDYYLENNSTALDVIEKMEEENIDTELIILSGQKDVDVVSNLMQKRIVNNYIVKNKNSFSKIVALLG